MILSYFIAVHFRLNHGSFSRELIFSIGTHWRTQAQQLPPADKSFEKECVLFFADIVQVFGVPKSVGQIYGLLYASPEPLGFVDIVERLEISKGSASQGLQLLRALGAIVEAEGQNGLSRGVAFEPVLRLRHLITGVLRERVVPMATAGVERLKLLRSLADQTTGNRAFYTARAKKLEKWRTRFNAILPILVTLLGDRKKAKDRDG